MIKKSKLILAVLLIAILHSGILCFNPKVTSAFLRQRNFRLRCGMLEKVALTFDGQGTDKTSQIMDILEKYEMSDIFSRVLDR